MELTNTRHRDEKRKRHHATALCFVQSVLGVSSGTVVVVLTPVSDIKALAHLLRQGELLRLREPQKWILRPIWGLGRDRYVFASYHPCWLVTTPEVLISGHIVVGVIFSGRKGGYL